jgi:hypothetical protein
MNGRMIIEVLAMGFLSVSGATAENPQAGDKWSGIWVGSELRVEFKRAGSTTKAVSSLTAARYL